MTSTARSWSPDSAAVKRPWPGFREPEIKRRKRVVRYKMYNVEGRVKATIRNGIRWIKSKCSEIIHGY
ncbi:hypothetical protein PHJA_000205600 [Phtheirospermum japonicum]|uniref:Uncharacterized protein n=1 Tax=Phtheirospermum japonicum TaxID=374723 RepID=A0A830B7Z7_9LAMI|nr:hypothetical protein PHJA_000205600 [Phtheirospermum japonicum]